MSSRFILSVFAFFLLLPLKIVSQEAYYKEHNPNYSPYHTLYTQQYFLSDSEYDPDQAAKVFRNGTNAERVRLVIKLKQVLDGKGLHVNLDAVPKDPDYIDSAAQAAIYRPYTRQPELFLEKINGKWYYSESAEQAIPKLYKELYPFGSDIWMNLLPAELHKKIFGLNTWQWFGILFILIAGFLVQRILIFPINLIIRRLSSKKVEWNISNLELPRKAAIAFSFFITIRVISILIPTLQFNSRTSQFLVFGLNIMDITFLVIFLWRLIDIIMMYAAKKADSEDLKMNDQVLVIVRKTLKIFLVLGATIGLLSMMGTNLTALLAGLSVGGLAVALAAQDTIKNMFGSLMILVDKPFKVGDWIQTDQINGVVESIGLRSTRVRSLEDSLIYVPNGKIADLTIDNLGMRNYRRFRTEIAITYDTPPFLIQKFCDGIKEILLRHPLTNKDRIDARLNKMGDSSLDILLICFIRVTDNSMEWSAHHDILMAIIQLAHDLNVRFAFPTSTLHLESFNNQPLPVQTPFSPEQAEASFRQFFRTFTPEWGKHKITDEEE